eukprot:TRINITY_DN26626_c0_g1_i1.p1 TRINITY_DN26626_c0_g1~~TRINITY_DN26626_c0_g1_i1.p1  ORF type:complete len:789 (-),score=101.51 TRINITY_DN26626_c0_g1_i1:269-2635(-)
MTMPGALPRSRSNAAARPVAWSSSMTSLPSNGRVAAANGYSSGLITGPCGGSGVRPVRSSGSPHRVRPHPTAHATPLPSPTASATPSGVVPASSRAPSPIPARKSMQAPPGGHGQVTPRRPFIASASTTTTSTVASSLASSGASTAASNTPAPQINYGPLATVGTSSDAPSMLRVPSQQRSWVPPPVINASVPPAQPQSWVPPPSQLSWIPPTLLGTVPSTAPTIPAPPSKQDSWVPPPVIGGASYVSPQLMQVPATQQGSWVPPPAVIGAPSYTPPPAVHVPQPKPNSWVPSLFIETTSNLQSVQPAPPQPKSWVPPPPAIGPPSYIQPIVQMPNLPPNSWMPQTAFPNSSPTAVSAVHSMAPGAQTNPAPARSLCNAEIKSGERLRAGAELTIGSHRIRCANVLGRGSFSEVWAGETVGAPGSPAHEVALKDITCPKTTDVQQAVFEANLLEKLRGPDMQIPWYLGHSVDSKAAGDGGGGSASDRGGAGNPGWRVRLAMTRAPGEPLDNFLRRPPPPGQDSPNAVRRGCSLATELIRQLAPTLEKINNFVWHRDINSHNILISDKLDPTGGPQKLQGLGDPEEARHRANFWLIDFGLAVDAKKWQTQWPTSDVGGDCRFWPPSSFLMSFYGPEHLKAHRHLCNQYVNRLDITGLGLTALEILCSTVASTSATLREDGLKGSWRRLFDSWHKYREEVSRWHNQIFHIFASGGDIGPLYKKLAQERVVERITGHHSQLRDCLKACTQRAEDVRIQNLLVVLAEMIDEKSTMGLKEAVEALNVRRVTYP